MSKRNLTIDDVAKAAGVARVTVSRVLNNAPNVRSETRRRVEVAVEKLGYSVNMQARALATGTNRQVILIHAHNPDQEPNSYYHAALELGALRACSSLGLDLVTRSVDPKGDEGSHFLSAIIERERPLGIIVSPPFSDDLKLLRDAKRLGVRIVAISAGDEAHDLAPGVGIDERAAGRMIGEYLLSLGHRQLGFIKGPEEHRAAALRYLGFTDALNAAGIEEPPWLGQGDFTFKSGVEAAERLLGERSDVTALACANDDMAAGAMLALHRHDVEIPSGISVTGFDDTPMSEVIWPPLTTIQQPIKLLAERAVFMLVNSERGSDLPPGHQTVEHKLIIRESTAPI